MHDKFIRIAVNKSRWAAIVCLFSVAIPVYWMRDARIDNSIEVWIGRSGTEYARYKAFLDKYGNEEFIVIAAEAEDPFSQEILDFQRTLAGRLREIDGVDAVLDITEAASLFAQHKSDWKELLGRNDFFRNLLLGQGGHTFGLIAWLGRIDNPPERKVAVERIEATVAAVSAGRINVRLAGTPLLNVALDRGSQRAAQRFLPIALAISVVVLAFVLRRPWSVVAVMCAVAVTTTWTIGLLVLAGKTFNMVTVTLPSLLIILSLAGGIHITSRFGAMLTDIRHKETQRPEVLHEVIREVLPPVLMSNVTTAVGFASLMISDMQPVVDFGQFAALGMLLSFMFNAAMVPGILSLRPAGAVTTRTMPLHWTARIGQSMATRRFQILPAAGVLCIACLLLMTRLRLESNVLKFFPEDSKVARDYHFIAERLTGLYTIELDASTETQKASTLLKEIERLGKAIASRPDVAKVIHYQNIATSLDAIPRPAFVPAAVVSRSPLMLMLRKYRHSEDDRLSLRMSILVRALSSTDFYSLMDFTKEQAAQTISADATCTLTGVVPLLNAAQRSLVTTQIESFAIAASVVLVLIGLFLQSVRALAAALLPNALPILCLFAFMALLRIPLDAATVMIAGIAIGIAVDDTIHFLSCFRTEKRGGLDDLAAVSASFQKASRAITFTSVVATSGFAILLLAEFKPIQYFGLLAGLTMITAWIGDVFVLPACAASLNPWNGRASPGQTQ